MSGTPSWFDEERDVLLGPADLRGLAHPLHLQLLGSLLHDGPAAALGWGRAPAAPRA